jgi:hypothetical protein
MASLTVKRLTENREKKRGELGQKPAGMLKLDSKKLKIKFA